jgi:hypothetical protein
MFRPADPSYSGETTWGQKASTPAGTSVNMPADYQMDGNLVQASIISDPLQPTESFQLDRLIVPTRYPRDFSSPIQSSSDPVDTPSPTSQERYPANIAVTSNPFDDEAVNDDWQQLQKIYRLHQEKNLEPKESPDSQNNIQRQREQGIKTGSPDKQSPMKPTVLNRSDEAPLSMILETQGEVEPLSIEDPTIESQELETKAVSRTKPDIDNLGSTPEKSKTHSKIRKTTDENPKAITPSVTHDKKTDHHDSEQEPPTDLNPEPSFPEQGETKAPANPLQSLPLESVWPVQRQPVESDDDNPTPGADTIQTVPLPESSLHDVSNDIQMHRIDTIQKTLSQVTPNQPTKSSIELIPPRRPRPDIQNPLAESRHETPSGLTDESNDLPLEEIQKDQNGSKTNKFPPKESQKQGNEKTIKETEPTDKGTPLGLYPSKKEVAKSQGKSITESQTQKVEDLNSNQQHQPQFELTKSQESRQKNDSELIQTDIGPLPADLWHILDKDPPLSNNVEEDVTETREGSPVRSVDVFRRSAVDIDGFPTTPKTSIPEPSASIQRAVTDDEVQTPTSTTSSSESPSETRSDEESSQPTVPDMRELSRRVYSEIRHKLMVEWERSRIRK